MADAPGGAVPPPADGGTPHVLALGELAARLGAYRWAEQRLFEVTGAWAGRPGLADEVRIHLFEVSAQHGWRAGLWRERLPVLAGVDPEALTVGAGPMLAPLFGALGALGTPDLDKAADLPGALDGRRVLAGLYRVVLPRLLVTYRAHLERAAPVSEEPTRRVLRIVLGDEEAQWLAGERLLQAQMHNLEDVRAAAAGQALLEEAAVAAGGWAGIVAPEQAVQSGRIPGPAPPT